MCCCVIWFVCVCVWAWGVNVFARFACELLCADVWCVLFVAFVCVSCLRIFALDVLCDVVWLVWCCSCLC